jgi:hypothetical protein
MTLGEGEVVFWPDGDTTTGELIGLTVTLPGMIGAGEDDGAGGVTAGVTDDFTVVAVVAVPLTGEIIELPPDDTADEIGVDAGLGVGLGLGLGVGVEVGDELGAGGVVVVVVGGMGVNPEETAET